MDKKSKKLNLRVSPDNWERDSLPVLRAIRPEWQEDQIRYKIFTEGITNKLWCCYLEDDPQMDDGVIFRIYGEGSELLIDRQHEIRNMILLHAVGCGASLYAEFNNGLAYEYIDGVCLDEHTVRDPHIASLIAKEMVAMHSIDKDYVAKHGIDISVEPNLFTKLHSWLKVIPDHMDDPKKNQRFKKEVPSKDELLAELQDLERHLVPLNSPSVFTHNDILLKNIVYNKEKESVMFIDFEYGAFNYLAFDVGNHFAEYAGIDTVDYRRYPDREYQLWWLQTYLEHRNKMQGRSPGDITNHDVEVFYVQANKFALAAHFFWGMWALIQAKHSAIDFDYLDYGITRFTEYFARKKQFLNLELPKNPK